MLNADVLTFQEFVTHEPLPLSTIQRAVLECLQGRDDAVLFGAQAVNAYVAEPRANQNVDIMSNRSAEFAEELRAHLSDRFHIAVRVREVANKGFRIYQTRKDGNRHLVDVRVQDPLPGVRLIEKVQVLSSVDLIVSKVISYDSRRGKPKSGTDWRHLALLLSTFPELKAAEGEVAERLRERRASERVIEFWNDLVRQDFSVEEDDDLSF